MALPATTDPTASRQLFELERALAQLPLEQRQVILLVGLEGMSYQDAAGILLIPVGTVRSHLFLAIKINGGLQNPRSHRCYTDQWATDPVENRPAAAAERTCR